ncbi:hypothetical protein FRB95_004904 [Tulasnella sp. JGI-2019a]|nr:hypothetical protein FRB93_012834 [Tulasnella sp. JGI-2019a]KAG9029807.1 hypothetical protein FRB95_004904 [Tulasnella sp. JGI-2019a]
MTTLLPSPTTSTDQHTVYDGDQVEDKVKEFFKGYELPSNVSTDLRVLRDRVKLRVSLIGIFVILHVQFFILAIRLQNIHPDAVDGLSMLSKVAVTSIGVSGLALLTNSYMSVVLARVQDDSRRRCERKSIERIQLACLNTEPSLIKTPSQLLSSLSIPERLFIENGTPGVGEKANSNRRSKYLTLYGVEEKSEGRLRPDDGAEDATRECARLLSLEWRDGYPTILEVFGGVHKQSWKWLHSIWRLAFSVCAACAFFQICGMIWVTEPLALSAFLIPPTALYAWILLPATVYRG